MHAQPQTLTLEYPSRMSSVATSLQHSMTRLAREDVPLFIFRTFIEMTLVSKTESNMWGPNWDGLLNGERKSETVCLLFERY